MRLRLKREVTLARLSLPVFYAELCMVSILCWLAFAHVEIRGEETAECLKDLALPAPFEQVVENPDPCRLVLVVSRDGSIYVCGALKPDVEVRFALQVEARLSRERGTAMANRLVLIAADQRTEFRHIRKIINWCKASDTRIWRLAFAGRPILPDRFEDD